MNHAAYWAICMSENSHRDNSGQEKFKYNMWCDITSTWKHKGRYEGALANDGRQHWVESAHTAPTAKGVEVVPLPVKMGGHWGIDSHRGTADSYPMGRRDGGRWGREGGREEGDKRCLWIAWLRLKLASPGTQVTLVIWRAVHMDHISHASADHKCLSQVYVNIRI